MAMILKWPSRTPSPAMSGCAASCVFSTFNGFRQVYRKFHADGYLRCVAPLSDYGFAITFSQEKQTLIFLDAKSPETPPYQVQS